MDNEIALNKRHWWLLGLGAVAALLLGMAGFYEYAADTPPHFLDLLYRALQLFTLESGDLKHPIPVTLEIARWLAPFVTFFAAIKGILSLLHRESQTILRLRNIQQHAILCGLSSKGIHMAQELLDKGHRVIVIDRNAQHKNMSVLTNQGAIAIIGDAQDPEILARTKIETARYLFAVTGDDDSNIAIINAAHNRITKQQNRDSTLDCYAHVTDQTTKVLFYNHPLFSKSKKQFNAQLFNLYDRGARLMFDQYAPDRNRSIYTIDDKQVTLLIFGLSQLAKSMIIHAALTGHYANGKKLAITIIDEHASHQVAELALSSPALDEILNITPIDSSLAELSSKRILKYLKQRPDAIYIFSPVDVQAITLAQRLQHLLGDTAIPVVAGLLQTSSAAELLCKAHSLQSNSVRLFPLIDNTISLDQILSAQQDQAARLIHEMYCEDQISRGETTESNSSLIPWDSLSEGMKDSNRGQADHLIIKLRAIGLTLENVINSPEHLTFTEEQIQLLSEMEHRRWMAGKRLDGWRPTQGKKNDDLKLNPLIVDFDLLPEDEKRKDVQTIITIPRLIDLMRKNQPAG